METGKDRALILERLCLQPNTITFHSPTERGGTVSLGKRGAILSLAMVVMLSLSGAVARCGEFQQVITVDQGDLFVGQKAGYDLVELEGYRYPPEVGRPMLPVTIATVTLPGLVVITGIEIVSTEIEVLEGSYTIMPGQQPVPISRMGEPGSIDFTPPDPQVYGSSQPYPENVVELVNTADLDGHSLAHVRVSPVQYEPQEGKLIFHRRIEYIIHYEEREEEPLTMGVPPGDYDYVIVTSSSYVNAFQPLADWKHKKGLKTIIVTTGDVQNWYGGTGTSHFRSFVQDAHEDWSAEWILLGGDVNIIPEEWRYFSGPGNTYGDTYLADYDGDWVCEVAVGRASVNSTSEVQTFVNKVLTYEKDPPVTNYPLDVTLIMMDLDSITECEETSEYYIVPKIPSRFALTKVYDSDSGNHETKATDAYNDGQNISIHMDHSWTDGIGVGSVNHGWYLESYELSSFSNYDKTALMYTGGCHPGDYEASDCFGEYWVFKHPEKVGYAFIGNAGYGWYNYEHCEAYSGQYMIAFAKSLFQEERRHLGDALNDHKNDNPPGSDGYLQYIFYELNLLGDPEMPAWLNTPENMTVTHATSIPMGEQDFTVTVKDGASGIQGARVCLMKGDEVYAVGTTNYSGNVALTINPTTAGTMDVTVTAYDYLPYEGTCEVGGMPDVTVTLDPDATVVPRGGTLGYTAAVTNHGGTSVTFDYWTDVILWTGKPYKGNPVFGPLSVSLNPGQTRQGHVGHKVPNNAPLETYSCCGRIGSYPGSIWDEDCFQFTVVEGSGSGGIKDVWEVIEDTF
jgi:hypothetical protein